MEKAEPARPDDYEKNKILNDKRVSPCVILNRSLNPLQILAQDAEFVAKSQEGLETIVDYRTYHIYSRRGWFNAIHLSMAI